METKKKYFSCALLLTFLCPYFSANSLASPIKILNPQGMSFDFSKLALPESVGKVEEVFQGTNGRTVILIQDAHAILDAQRNIQKAIDYFQQNHAVKLVAVEGASSEFDVQLLKSFPNKKILFRVFDNYMKKSEMTGVSAAALFNERDSIYKGVEDWELYEEGVRLYLSASQGRKEILDEINKAKVKLRLQKERIYGHDLLKVDRAMEDFQFGKSDFIDTVKTLFAIEPPERNSPLALLIGDVEEKSKKILFEVELQKIIKEIRKKLSASAIKDLNAKEQAFKTSQMRLEAFGLYLERLINEHSFSIRISDSLLCLIRQQKKIDEMQGTEILKAFEAYADAIKKPLFRNETERELDHKSRQFLLLERLVKLELSRKDWTELKKSKVLLIKNLENYLNFYKNSELREKAFFYNLIQFMEENHEKTSLLVAGGFHTDGLKELLSEDGISVVVVAPRIEQVSEKNLYTEMMNGNVSWKSYFKTKNGKVNLHQAFMRASRDRLLKQEPEGDGARELLRSWREQIIRDLASKKKVSKVSAYTKFIDEAAQEKNIKPKWERDTDAFIEKLKHLNQMGQFNKDNILKVVQPANILQPTGNPFAKGQSSSLFVSAGSFSSPRPNYGASFRSEVRSKLSPDLDDKNAADSALNSRDFNWMEDVIREHRFTVEQWELALKIAQAKWRKDDLVGEDFWTIKGGLGLSNEYEGWRVLRKFVKRIEDRVLIEGTFWEVNRRIQDANIGMRLYVKRTDETSSYRPVPMIKASDIGYRLEDSLTIFTSIGEQKKPANRDVFLFYDFESFDFKLLLSDGEGNPEGYLGFDPLKGEKLNSGQPGREILSFQQLKRRILDIPVNFRSGITLEELMSPHHQSPQLLTRPPAEPMKKNVVALTFLDGSVYICALDDKFDAKYHLISTAGSKILSAEELPGRVRSEFGLSSEEIFSKTIPSDNEAVQPLIHAFNASMSENGHDLAVSAKMATLTLDGKPHENGVILTFSDARGTRSFGVVDVKSLRLIPGSVDQGSPKVLIETKDRRVLYGMAEAAVPQDQGQVQKVFDDGMKKLPERPFSSPSFSLLKEGFYKKDGTIWLDYIDDGGVQKSAPLIEKHDLGGGEMIYATHPQLSIIEDRDGIFLKFEEGGTKYEFSIQKPLSGNESATVQKAYTLLAQRLKTSRHEWVRPDLFSYGDLLLSQGFFSIIFMGSTESIHIKRSDSNAEPVLILSKYESEGFKVEVAYHNSDTIVLKYRDFTGRVIELYLDFIPEGISSGEKSDARSEVRNENDLAQVLDDVVSQAINGHKIRLSPNSSDIIGKAGFSNTEKAIRDSVRRAKARSDQENVSNEIQAREQFNRLKEINKPVVFEVHVGKGDPGKNILLERALAAAAVNKFIVVRIISFEKGKKINLRKNEALHALTIQNQTQEITLIANRKLENHVNVWAQAADVVVGSTQTFSSFKDRLEPLDRMETEFYGNKKIVTKTKTTIGDFFVGALYLKASQISERTLLGINFKNGIYYMQDNQSLEGMGRIAFLMQSYRAAAVSA